MEKVSGKLWGGLLGMMFGGPLGAIAGVYIGHRIDDSLERRSRISEVAIFQINLIAILAHVAKIDGHVDKREIEAILSFYRALGFKGQLMDKIAKTLEFALTQEINLQTTCRNFKKSTKYEARLILLRVIYFVVMADEVVHPNEKAVIKEIVEYLGLAKEDYEMLRAEFFHTDDKHYQVLGLKRGASKAEVKKAYRKQALAHHPDRVAYLGEEFVKVAEEKFKAINEAHEKINKEMLAVQN